MTHAHASEQQTRRGPVVRLLSTVVLAPVHLWRALAPMRMPRCRYYPTCSSYAVEAVASHGPLRGAVLAARRVGRCHPWSPGGFDHVPPASASTAWRCRHPGPSPTADPHR